MEKFTTLETSYYIISLLALAWLVQVLYYLIIMARVGWKKQKPTDTSASLPPVSVIICAKNEEANLKAHLPLILAQDYPEFQLIVVNDCSEDDTELLLSQLKREHPSLYYTNIPVDKKFFHGKKLALTVGIKAARHEHLIFTDADCYPHSPNWLRSMASQFTSTKELVLGYGPYSKTGGFLNRVIRYETFWNAIQYMGHAIVSRPFMGVGRNIAYTKSFFSRSSQFRNHLNIASGDDDLLVSEAGTKQNTTICFRKESQTVSVPKMRMSDWLLQKSRHLSTSDRYPLVTKLLLASEIISRQIFYLLTIYSLIFNIFVPISLGLLISRIILLHVIIIKSAIRFEEKGTYFAVLVMDILIPWMQAVAWVINIFGGNKNKWR